MTFEQLDAWARQCQARWTRDAPAGFTLHSLRNRYANTALHVWKYTEEVLLQQGS